MKLAHRSFSPDDLWNIETQLVNALFQIDEDDIREDLETVPTPINDNLTAVPHLRGMAHPRLRKLVLVDLGLAPRLFLSVENKDVVHDSFLAVTLSAAEDDQVLSELSRRVAVTRRRRLRSGNVRIDLNGVP